MNQSKYDQESIYDKKWLILNKYSFAFTYIPFVKIVFGSGSLALGNVSENSDLDVLICTKQGRIFTVRFIAHLILLILGVRRSKEHGSAQAKDKVCLNHFLAENNYQLTKKSNKYYELLYQHLVPVFGKEEEINEFYSKNITRLHALDTRHIHTKQKPVIRRIEAILEGKAGDILEKVLKAVQVYKIKKGGVSKRYQKTNIYTKDIDKPVKLKLKPSLVYTDSELEFHPEGLEINILRQM